MKILLVEDNERVTQFVVKGLQEAGHTTDHAGNGRDGMFLAASEPYDVIIMDRMLPGGIDGLAIIEVLRKAGKRTPILILSALSEVDDRIRGLRSGGDDYLTKPFAFGELLALGLDREVHHHDAVFLHDADQQDDADQGHHGQIDMKYQ